MEFYKTLFKRCTKNTTKSHFVCKTSSTSHNTPSCLCFRHVIFAPSSHNKYAGESFPGIYDALFGIENSADPEKAWEEVRRQISIAAFTVNAAAMTLTPPAWNKHKQSKAMRLSYLLTIMWKHQNVKRRNTLPATCTEDDPFSSKSLNYTEGSFKLLLFCVLGFLFCYGGTGKTWFMFFGFLVVWVLY